MNDVPRVASQAPKLCPIAHEMRIASQICLNGDEPAGLVRGPFEWYRAQVAMDEVRSGDRDIPAIPTREHKLMGQPAILSNHIGMPDSQQSTRSIQGLASRNREMVLSSANSR